MTLRDYNSRFIDDLTYKHSIQTLAREPTVILVQGVILCLVVCLVDHLRWSYCVLVCVWLTIHAAYLLNNKT